MPIILLQSAFFLIPTSMYVRMYVSAKIELSREAKSEATFLPQILFLRAVKKEKDELLRSFHLLRIFDESNFTMKE